MREELITSAVSFLSDPKVQSAALAKKVSFLESKGLTPEEIEEAMARANGKAPTIAPASQGTMMISQPGMVSQSIAPPVPARPTYDWRDIFIAAMLAGGVGYGVWNLAKYLFGPWFTVPTQKQLEEDKEKLDAQFQAVEEALNEIKDETNNALTAVATQSKAIDESLSSLDNVIKELKAADRQKDEEFKSIKADIESLKDLVPKTLERNKDSQNAVLLDLQNEMKSLKSLLISRRTTSSVVDQISSSTPSIATTIPSTNVSSPTDGLSSRLAATINSSGGRAGIPAWQMKSSSSNNEASGSSN